MNYILLIISLILGVTKNIIPKSGKNEFQCFNNLMSVNIITAIVGIVIFASKGIDFSLLSGAPFIAMAFLYGLCTLGSQSLYMIAAQAGSVSVCSLIYAACFIIPTVFTAICYSESFSAFRIIGIATMLLSVVMISVKGEENTKGSKSAPTQKYSKKFYLLALLLSLSVVIANKLNMFLVGALPGLVFFPVINGGTIMFSAIVSKYLFKEKLSVLSWCGIFTGILAIILIAF